MQLGMKVAVTFEQASKDVWLTKFKPYELLLNSRVDGTFLWIMPHSYIFSLSNDTKGY